MLGFTSSHKFLAFARIGIWGLSTYLANFEFNDIWQGDQIVKKLKSLMTAHNYTNYQQIQLKVAQNKLLSWNFKIDGFDISLGQLDGCTPLYVLGQFSTYQV
jgi:hypothetical protein